MPEFTQAERQRLKAIISDTITMLCRNGLNAKFDKEFIVQGLIGKVFRREFICFELTKCSKFRPLRIAGVTIDSEDLLLVNINDTIKNPNAISDEKADQVSSTPGKRKGRKRRASSDDDYASGSKSPRHDDDDFNSTFQTATPGRSRRSMYDGDDSRASFTTEQSADDFSLSELKHDDDDEDEDLVEIIKEEPSGSSSQIVSIQSMGPPPSAVAPSGPPMPGQISMGDLNEVGHPS